MVHCNFTALLMRLFFIPDVDDVKYVINVDFPNCSEDYIHRIGRTARCNNTGTAYTFFTFENMKQAKDLVDVLQEANQTVNPKLLDLVEMSRSFSFGRGMQVSFYKISKVFIPVSIFNLFLRS